MNFWKGGQGGEGESGGHARCFHCLLSWNMLASDRERNMFSMVTELMFSLVIELMFSLVTQLEYVS